MTSQILFHSNDTILSQVASSFYTLENMYFFIYVLVICAFPISLFVGAFIVLSAALFFYNILASHISGFKIHIRVPR